MIYKSKDMPLIKFKRKQKANRNDLYDKKFYTRAKWRKLRQWILNHEGLCRMCAAEGRTTEATTVDHIIPRRIKPELEYDPSNLQPLCYECHSKKTNDDKKKYKGG
jgi:5-methylcytosine-specific restriction protein A